MLAGLLAAARLGVQTPLAGKVARLGSNWYRNGSNERGYKVTLVGAGGGIGQPLGLLLKQNSLIEELTLHDLVVPKGVALDLSHICTSTQVDFFGGEGEEPLIDALHDSHVVIVAAGMPRKPKMTREQLLDVNSNVAMTVASAAAVACPDALLAFITNPVNVIVPIAAEVLKAKGVYNANRLFGVTTLDVVRAKTFIADALNLDPAKVQIPVIGGHSGKTILPIFSQCSPPYPGEADELVYMTKRIQNAGTDVVEAKAGKGSATLSMAYAGAHFVNALLRGLNGEADVVECAYVDSNVTELPFFATPVLLGRKGIQANLGLPDMNKEEQSAMKNMMAELRHNIDTGILYAQSAIRGVKGKVSEKTATQPVAQKN